MARFQVIGTLVLTDGREEIVKAYVESEFLPTADRALKALWAEVEGVLCAPVVDIRFSEGAREFMENKKTVKNVILVAVYSIGISGSDPCSKRARYRG